MGDVETLKHKFDVLRGHCEDVGRDYEEIIRSTNANVYLLNEGEDPEKATEKARMGRSYDEYAKEFIVGTPEQVVEALQPKVDACVEYFTVYMPRVAYDPTPIERFAEEVVPHFD